MRWPALMMFALMAAVPAAAQKADDAKCAGVTPALPDGFKAWNNRTMATAAAAQDGLSGTQLTPGQAIDAKLASGGSVRFLVKPGRASEAGGHAGMFAFTVPSAGTYRVGLGSGGWVDVIEDGKAVESSAHGHGPDCSGIRKIVDFPLKAGRHVLQIEGGEKAVTALMIVRAP